MMVNITDIKVTKPYTLWIEFDEGISGELDLTSFSSLFELTKTEFSIPSISSNALHWNEEVEFDLLNTYLQIKKIKFEDYANC